MPYDSSDEDSRSDRSDGIGVGSRRPSRGATSHGSSSSAAHGGGAAFAGAPPVLLGGVGEAVDHEVPAVSVEALLDMPDHERHLLVQRRFDAIKHNRRLREDGRDADGYALRQFTSNFKQLMRTLESDDARAARAAAAAAASGGTAAVAAKAARRRLPPHLSGGGKDGAGGATTDDRFSGPLMEEIRRMEEEEANKKRQKMRAAIRQAQKHQQQLGGGGADADGDGDGDDDDMSGDFNNAGALKAVLDLIDEDDVDKASVAHIPDDVRALNKTAAATARKTEEMSDAEDRNERIRLLGQMMKAHLALARPRWTRSRSSPGAFRSMATFEDVTATAAAQAERLTELQAQLDGAAPRPRERQLEKQITSLEDQIANQIALIRGLREKLRILREQHRHCVLHQRPINAAIKNAYGSGFIAGQMDQAMSGGGGNVHVAAAQPPPSVPPLSGVAAVGGSSRSLLPPMGSVGGAQGKPPQSGAAASAPIPDSPRTLARNASTAAKPGTAQLPVKPGTAEGSNAKPSTAAAMSSNSANTNAAPNPQNGTKSARTFPDVRNQTVDDAGGALPQGKAATAVVINAHSLTHLGQVMPEVLPAQLAVLAAVLKPTSMAAHLYPQPTGGGAGGFGSNTRGGQPFGGASRGGAQPPSTGAGGSKASRHAHGRGGQSPGGQHSASAARLELHPFLSCRGVEAARYVCDGTARFVFVFPSATDAVVYCLLTQQRLLDAAWSPALGDEYETGVELAQGSTTEYVWRGLRVSMGLEAGAAIRPDVLLYDCSVPPPMVMSQGMLGGGGGGGANSSSRGTPMQLSPLPATLSVSPAGGHLVSPTLIGVSSPLSGAFGGGGGSFGAANASADVNTSGVSATAEEEEEARGLEAANSLFAASSPAVAVPYEGHAVDTAAYLCSIGVGGEVLLTKAVVDAIDVEAVTEALGAYNTYKYLTALGAVEVPFADLTPLLRYWGDLAHHFSRASVFRILGPTVGGREGVFRRDIVNAERSFATQQATAARGPFDDVPAPSVTMAGRPIALLGVVLTDWPIASRGLSPSVAATAKGIVFAAVREVSIACRGYVSRVLNNCEGYLLAFEEPVNALSFGLRIHDHLMGTEWPESILRIPQFSRVEVEGKVLFCGPRVQCGMQLCTPGKRTAGASVVFTYRDALTQRTLYCGGGTELASLYTQQSCGGELLVAADALPVITKHHEFLGFASHAHCVDAATAASDTLIALYQVFTRRRRLCASFVNRETRLRSEDDAATDSKMVRMYEDQIAVLKEKLFHKDQSIKRLDAIIGEKNNVIAEIRSEVMKHAHYKYSHSETIAKLSVGSSRPTLDSVLVGISFSNAAEIYRKFPLDAAAAAKLYGQLLDRTAQECHARLIARLPSGVARIYQFGEPMKAVEFWTKVFERGLAIDWPTKLEDSAEAGLIRAVDIVENLHANLDQLIWRGLRPIAVMDYGLPNYQFDSVSRAFAPYGPEIDFIGQMLGAAGDGDCILSPSCALQLTKAIASSRNTSIRLAPYGPDGCERLTSSDMRLRLKALRTMFAPGFKRKVPQVRTIHKALAVFVGISAAASLTTAGEEQFTADVLTFQRCVERLIVEYKGELVGTDGGGHRFSILFSDVDDGIDFMSTIHTVLMHCTWSSALLREPEFADRIYENKQIMGGIGAKVGAHIVHGVSVTPQQFGGARLYSHKELSFPCVLSHHAHAGETLATEEVFTELMQSTKERSAKIYPDLIGALTGLEEVRSHPVHVYQILPMELHFRSALFLEEDRINSDPMERQRRKNQSKRVTSKRRQYFEGFIKDEQMLQTCERTLNPIDDPVRLNQRLYSHIKAAMDADRQRFETSQRTLQMLESISMLTEDRASLPNTARGYPFHVHLVLYMMENGAACRDYMFDKRYAVELLRADWGDDEDPDAEGKTINALLSHVGGAGTVGGGAGAAARKRGSSRFGPKGGGAADAGDGDDDLHVEETFKSRMQHIQGQKVLPEDLVQLHVDVERFANIVELNGLTREAGRQWVACFPDLCVASDKEKERGAAETSAERRRSINGGGSPQQQQGGTVNSKQLRLLASMRSTIGLQIDDVDSEMIRNSVVANLSHILHKILYANEDLPGGGPATRRGSVV